VGPLARAAGRPDPSGLPFGAQDPVACIERTGAFEVVTCTGPPPPNTQITLVITSGHAVGTFG